MKAIALSAVLLLGANATQEVRYHVTLTVTSELPGGNVPLDPLIDFGKIIADGNLAGVLDPNSIVVINKATGQPVAFGRTEDFAYGQRCRLEWVIRDPTHTVFDIYFRTAAKRPPLRPRVWRVSARDAEW